MRRPFVLAPLLVVALILLALFAWKKQSGPQTLGEAESATITLAPTPGPTPQPEMRPEEIREDGPLSLHPVSGRTLVKTTKASKKSAKKSTVALNSAPDAGIGEVARAQLFTKEEAAAIIAAEAPNESLSSPSNFGFSFFAGHGMGAESGLRSFSEFLIEASYQASQRGRVVVGQDAKKLYEIAATGEEEFLPGDTHLFYQYALGEEFLDSKWMLETGVTLPISHESSSTKNVTRAHIALHVSKAVLSNRVTLSAAPYYAYSFNSNATDNNGSPLQKMVLGGQLEANWEILAKKLHLVVWGKGYYRMYEQFDFSQTTPSPTTSFGLGTYVEYRFTDGISTQVGLNRGTSLLPNVRYDAAFYDREATRYYVALSINL